MVASPVDRLAREFGVEVNEAADLPPSYNVAPTQPSNVVLARPIKGSGNAEPVRQLRTLQWGLVPSWAKDTKIGNKMINARAETVHEKPAFRKAFATRRAMVPTDGFYEWLPTDEIGRSGQPLKQPFYIHRKDDGLLAFAGLYEFWRDPDKAKDDEHAWLTTFTIITTTATDDVGRVHDRMPMTVAEEDWEQWLDPRQSNVDAVRQWMTPPPAGSLDVYPVSRDVNKIQNNDPSLIEPMPVDA